MTLREMQVWVARRCVDATYREELEGVAGPAVDRFARSLWSKRYGEAIGVLPRTAKCLGAQCRERFDQHCARYRPRGPRRWTTPWRFWRISSAGP